jgi:hypothetical protein
VAGGERWKTYDNDRLFRTFGIHLQLPDYWREVHQDGAYLLLLAQKPASQAGVILDESATSVQQETHVELALWILNPSPQKNG